MLRHFLIFAQTHFCFGYTGGCTITLSVLWGLHSTGSSPTSRTGLSLYGLVVIGLPRFSANTASRRVWSSDLSFSHSTSHRWQTSSHHTGSVIFSMPMTLNCTSHWTKMNPLKYCKTVLTRFIPGLPRTDCHLIRRNRRQSYSGLVRGWDARTRSHPCRLLKQLSAHELAFEESRCDDRQWFDVQWTRQQHLQGVSIPHQILASHSEVHRWGRRYVGRYCPSEHSHWLLQQPPIWHL